MLRDVTRRPRRPEAGAAGSRCSGMRSINNVVDVSNYVMLELGQPNHPYDLAKVAGPGLPGAAWPGTARRSPPSTTSSDASPPRTSSSATATTSPIGIGGIMGGAASEIDDATTDVLLEMAWFHPIGIVKSSRRHKLRSEASARFEKGCDPEVVDLAMRRFAELLGAPLEDGAAVATGTLPERPPVRVRTARVARLLGTELVHRPHRRAARPDRVHHHAGRRRPRRRDPVVALRLRDRDRRDRGDRPPPRLHAPSAARSRGRPPPAALSPRQAERRRLRSLLVGRGLTEAMPMPFLAPGELARLRPARRRHHDRQPARGRAVGAPHRAAARPGRRGRLQLVAPQPRRPPLRDRPHLQPPVVARRRPPRRARVPRRGARRLRGPRGRPPVAVRLRGARRAPAPASRTARCPGFHPTRAARILVGDVRVGARRRDRSRACSTPTASASGSPTSRSTSTRCSTCPHGERTFRPFSLFPSSDIDLAFEVDEDVPASAVEDAIRAAGGDLLWSVRLFDVYRGTGRGRRPPQPRLHPPPPGPRPHPHRRRRRRRPASRSSTPSSPSSPPPSGARSGRSIGSSSDPARRGRPTFHPVSVPPAFRVATSQ